MMYLLYNAAFCVCSSYKAALISPPIINQFVEVESKSSWVNIPDEMLSDDERWILHFSCFSHLLRPILKEDYEVKAQSFLWIAFKSFTSIISSKVIGNYLCWQLTKNLPKRIFKSVGVFTEKKCSAVMQTTHKIN